MTDCSSANTQLIKLSLSTNVPYLPRTDKTGTDKDDLVGKKPNPLRRLQLFYTSPAVKFILNGITYLIFLGDLILFYRVWEIISIDVIYK